MDVLEKITELAGRVAATNGLELVDTEIFRAGRRRVVRVYLGKAEGVSVDDCAKVSRGMSAVLDAENWLGDEAYVLEVSSPGLDRPFKTLADWTRNLGREVRVSCREKVENRFEHRGKLVAVDAEAAVLETSSGNVTVPMGQVALAKLEIKVG